jgi:hypothetical protein
MMLVCKRWRNVFWDRFCKRGPDKRARDEEIS